MITIVIIGAGNVAQHLYKIFSQKEEVSVIQCYNRKGISIDKKENTLSVTNNLEEIVKANIYIIAVSDDAIVEITKKLPFKNRLVVHTSGSVPMTLMSTNNKRGVFYPLQTFSIHNDVNFEEVPFCLESENTEDYILLEKLANALSNRVYSISSHQRNILHVAAVFVNNFVNHMFTMGNEICNENNVPFEILHPLILETAKKIIEIEPSKIQTGPAIREDKRTIDRHLTILKKDSQKELYNILTNSIVNKHGKKL